MPGDYTNVLEAEPELDHVAGAEPADDFKCIEGDGDFEELSTFGCQADEGDATEEFNTDVLDQWDDDFN